MIQIPRKKINELIEKYGTAVPRYTSYPTAPEWKDDFDQFDFEAAIEKSNATKKDLSLYLHIPFCESQCYFCGCNVVISPQHGIEEAYLEQLCKEIEYYGELFDKNRKVAQMAWGGGTPTFLTPKQIYKLYSVIDNSFNLYSNNYSLKQELSDTRHSNSKKAELTDSSMSISKSLNNAVDEATASGYEYAIEIDPRVTTVDHLKALYDCGFNRLSMGIQDFNTQTQKSINRIQSKEEVGALTKAAREIGFNSINYDLIYGLPHQDLANFKETIKAVKELDPDRIALFNYAHLPSMIPHQKKYINDDHLPSKETKLDIFDHAVEAFSEHGYEFIGIDHFAKKDDSLVHARDENSLYRNFQGYTTFAGCDMISFGITGISDIQGVYKQNPKKLNDYYTNFKQAQKAKFCSKEDIENREIIKEIMCNNFVRLNKAQIEGKLDRLEEFAQDGILQISLKGDEFTLVITDLGRFFVRNVASLFDTYVEKETGFKAFSQAL